MNGCDIEDYFKEKDEYKAGKRYKDKESYKKAMFYFSLLLFTLAVLPTS